MRIDDLIARGLTSVAAASKAELFGKCEAALTSMAAKKGNIQPAAAGRKSPFSLFVPGRIEVLGKHTDYCGGRSLVCAADRGFCVLAFPRDDALVRITDVVAGESREFEFSPELLPPLGDWANYPMTVARRLARNFPGKLQGAGDRLRQRPAPRGRHEQLQRADHRVLPGPGQDQRPALAPEYRQNIHSPEDLAGYIATHENGQNFGTLVGDKGVGTFGGSEDHTAILCCKPASLALYSYCPVRFEREIGMPEGCCFAIGSSGVVAEKTGEALAKFNRASLRGRRCRHGMKRPAARMRTFAAALVRLARRSRATGGNPEREGTVPFSQTKQGTVPGEFTTADLASRFEQFQFESEHIIPTACDALASERRGRLRPPGRAFAAVGRAVAGQPDRRNDFPRPQPRQCGAAAASSFGAGFGGAVWAMVQTSRTEEFLRQWSERYHSKFPAHAARSKFFLTQAGPAAFEL